MQVVDPRMQAILDAVNTQFRDPQWCFLLVEKDFLRHQITVNNVELGFAGKPIRFTHMAAERVAKQFADCPLKLKTEIIPEILSALPERNGL